MTTALSGSLGHIGRPLPDKLVHVGHRVTVVSRKTERAAGIEALGATAAIGSVDEVDFLSRSLQGADAVYTMVPPLDSPDENFDLRAKIREIGDACARAIGESEVKRIVHLSSMTPTSGRGQPPSAHSLVEERLMRLRRLDMNLHAPRL